MAVDQTSSDELRPEEMQMCEKRLSHVRGSFSRMMRYLFHLWRANKSAPFPASNCPAFCFLFLIALDTCHSPLHTFVSLSFVFFFYSCRYPFLIIIFFFCNKLTSALPAAPLLP